MVVTKWECVVLMPEDDMRKNVFALLDAIQMKLPDGSLISYTNWAKSIPIEMLRENTEHMLSMINVSVDKAYSNAAFEHVKRYHLSLILLAAPQAIDVDASGGLKIKSGVVPEDYNTWAVKTGMEKLRNDVKAMLSSLRDRARNIGDDDLILLHGGVLSLCADISKPVPLK